MFIFFFAMYKNEWKESKFRWQKNQKSHFYKNKKIAKINDIDVNGILDSKEEPYCTKNSFKHCIGYNDNDVIRPLCIKCIKLPQMTGYARKFESNTILSYKISDKQLLKKYNQILKKIWKLLKIEFDSTPVYDDNDKYIKAKIEINGDSVITNFQ